MPQRGMAFVMVGLGGAVGSCARYAITQALARAASWPLGTFVVNVSGSLALGLVVGALGARMDGNLRALLLAGLLGGFTTFSALSGESLVLLRERPLVAAAYAGGSVVVGVLAAWAGERCGAALAR